MENEKVITIPAPAEQEAEPETLVKFSRPYTFEGSTYREIDLDQMDSLSAQDMVAAEKYLFKSGIISPLPDMTVSSRESSPPSSSSRPSRMTFSFIFKPSFPAFQTGSR